MLAKSTTLLPYASLMAPDIIEPGIWAMEYTAIVSPTVEAEVSGKERTR